MAKAENPTRSVGWRLYCTRIDSLRGDGPDTVAAQLAYQLIWYGYNLANIQYHDGYGEWRYSYCALGHATMIGKSTSTVQYRGQGMPTATELPRTHVHRFFALDWHGRGADGVIEYSKLQFSFGYRWITHNTASRIINPKPTSRIPTDVRGRRLRNRRRMCRKVRTIRKLIGTSKSLHDRGDFDVAIIRVIFRSQSQERSAFEGRFAAITRVGTSHCCRSSQTGSFIKLTR